jgi:MinD-like ATPase involved in chromosome partitioning or flagellar assembly
MLIGRDRDSREAGGGVVALVSAKGSPGVTTTAVGLAARWPKGRPVVVEADPAGGDLAARFGLSTVLGVASAALDCRDPAAMLDPRRWVQVLPCGVDVLLAPPGVEAAACLSVLGGHARRVLGVLAESYPLVLVDAGRWSPGSPADAVIMAADVVLVVARPRLEELAQAEARVAGLRELAADVRLVLVGEGPWPQREVAARLGVPVVDVLPVDGQGAGVLSGSKVPRRGWDAIGWTRLPLLRGCRGLAVGLHESFPPSSLAADEQRGATGGAVRPGSLVVAQEVRR